MKHWQNHLIANFIIEIQHTFLLPILLQLLTIGSVDVDVVGKGFCFCKTSTAVKIAIKYV